MIIRQLRVLEYQNLRQKSLLSPGELSQCDNEDFETRRFIQNVRACRPHLQHQGRRKVSISLGWGEEASSNLVGMFYLLLGKSLTDLPKTAKKLPPVPLVWTTTCNTSCQFLHVKD